MTFQRRRIAVIIPYFQREAGILRRALDSVRQQDLPDGISLDVFIIDDGSPLPAEVEVCDFQPHERLRLYAHRQENAGPGAARNNGLDRVHEDGGYSFVAFLDSDDEWVPSHIKNAVTALEAGYDFYFCDSHREGAFESYSSEVSYLANRGALLRSKHNCIQQVDGGLGFPAFALKDEMVGTCLCHTSCVVLRAGIVKSVRFDVELRSAGEDHMFWVAVILAGARTAITWEPNVRCGRGVNIFFNSFDWNKIETLDRVCNLALFGAKLCSMREISGASLALAAQNRRKYRKAYAYLVCRAILKRQSFRSPAFYRLCRYDPLFPFLIPFLALCMIKDRSPDARNF